MKKSSEVFVFGKDVVATPAGEGVWRKVLAYSENVMACEITVEKGAVVPEHVHPHEQCSNIIFGKGLFTVGDETKEVNAGDSVIMLPNVPHKVVALEKMVLIDVFAPMREDFV